MFGSSRKNQEVSVQDFEPPRHVDDEDHTSKSKVPVDIAAHGADSIQKLPDEDVQDGIKDIQAFSTVWSRSHLILAYVLCVSSITPFRANWPN